MSISDRLYEESFSKLEHREMIVKLKQDQDVA